MLTRYLTIFVLAWCGHLHAAAAAPSQLLNKTVVFSFTLQQMLREADGKTFAAPITGSFTDYISSNGRIFERSSRSAANGSKGGDHDPNATHNASGEARSARFEGSQLVHLTSFPSGAIRVVVSFDASFSSCSVDITMAREGSAPMRRKGPDGVMREILSSTMSGSNCSIRQGNAFAS